MLYKNQEQIEYCLQRMGYQILEETLPDKLALIGIKERGLPLAKRLKRNLEKIVGCEILLGELNISLYQNDLSLLSTGPIIHDVEIPFGIGGRELVLVDDVLITGQTAHAAIDAIQDLGHPARIRFACLVDVKRRELPIYADYVGWKLRLTRDEQLIFKISEIDKEEGIWVEPIKR
ncbi:MAG: bifunctional pyr operon transcriptional regulator/uracil phosphoribosyltransferase PyrR [Candidatus Wallbacteria bacterium]|nr:bifunctional pyr operon transcriptional regulator/uracil phosphoribosyltransferase PyrR [Candidatus Wallbacteria bacterium]